MVMNSAIKDILYIFLVIMLMCGCQKMPVNGDLDGQWQVMEVTENNHVIDRPLGQQYYICFSLHTVNLTTGQVVTSGNIHYDGQTLGMEFPYFHTPEENELLTSWGIYQNPVTFQIEKLTHKTLILKSGDVRVSCRKF